MAVAVTKDQPPRTDHHLFPGDPLGEFGTEDLDRTEVTHGATPLIPRISAPAFPIVASANVEPAKRPKLNGGWFVGTAMLVVGLLAGYAAGVATTTRNADDQNASSRSFPADRADSGQQRAEFQATAGRSSTGLIAEPVHDERRISEPDRRPPPPQSIDLLQRPLSPPVKMALPTTSGVLHLESRPTGAQVHLDDRLVATTPFRLYGVPAGSHTVRMELQGYQPWSTSVNVEAGSRGRIAASLEQ
jgi:PEGA domain